MFTSISLPTDEMGWELGGGVGGFMFRYKSKSEVQYCAKVLGHHLICWLQWQSIFTYWCLYLDTTRKYRMYVHNIRLSFISFSIQVIPYCLYNINSVEASP